MYLIDSLAFVPRSSFLVLDLTLAAFGPHFWGEPL
jgi:hypothetical protein